MANKLVSVAEFFTGDFGVAKIGGVSIVFMDDVSGDKFRGVFDRPGEFAHS